MINTTEEQINQVHTKTILLPPNSDHMTPSTVKSVLVHLDLARKIQYIHIVKSEAVKTSNRTGPTMKDLSKDGTKDLPMVPIYINVMSDPRI